MARTAIFSVVRNGASVCSIAIDASRGDGSARYHVNVDDAANDDGAAPLSASDCYHRTVSARHPVAVALWRSLTDRARHELRRAEPDLTAELDAGADGDSPGPAARASARAAARARSERDTQPDPQPSDERDA